MELIGYERGTRIRLHDPVKDYFTKLEQRLMEADKIQGLKIELKNGDQGVRADDPRETGILHIFDFSTSIEAPGQHRPDYFHYHVPLNRHAEEDLDFDAVAKWTGTHMYLENRNSIDAATLKRSALEKIRPFWPQFAEHTGITQDVVIDWGEFDYLTAWIKFPMYNIGKSDSSPAELLCKVLFDPIIDKITNAEFFDNREEYLWQEGRDTFMRAVRNLTNKQEQKLRTQLMQHENVQRDLESQLGNVLDNVRHTTIALKRAMEVQLDDDANFERTINELRKNKHIEKITFDKATSKMQVFTDQLYMYSPNEHERIDLGKMKIEFALAGGGRNVYDIMIFNLTNPKGGRQHPHVDETGLPCLGGFSGSMRSLFQRGELVALFEQTLQYLTTFNPDDAYAAWAAWWWQDDDKIEVLMGDGTYRNKNEVLAEKAEGEDEIDLELEMAARNEEGLKPGERNMAARQAAGRARDRLGIERAQ